jgi:acetyltransferase-like isoleucine patch superfamily enzyme
MADVGEHAIIGAGAVVNQPIPAYSVAVGVPARVVRALPRPSTVAVS